MKKIYVFIEFELNNPFNSALFEELFNIYKNNTAPYSFKELIKSAAQRLEDIYLTKGAFKFFISEEAVQYHGFMFAPYEEWISIHVLSEEEQLLMLTNLRLYGFKLIDAFQLATGVTLDD